MDIISTFIFFIAVTLEYIKFNTRTKTMDPIVENVEENGVVEKYKPLFTSSYKSLRIIKNRKSNNDYKDNGAMLSQVDKAFIFPFTKNRDEIFNAIYTIFGKSYKYRFS